MLITDIKRVVEQVSKDKGIEFGVLIKTLEEALSSAAKKNLGRNVDIEVKYNEEAGELEVFQFKEVVAVVEDDETEITVEEGRKLDTDCEIGDSLGLKVDTSTFGRIAAQSAKQVIIQKMKDAEREAVYESFISRRGEIINGIVQRMDRGDIIVNLGQTEAILPSREQINRESYRRGDRIRALIKDVLVDTRGPQVILTRASSEFLIALFKTEVPEIMESVVKIEGAAREAGARAKMAVSTTDSDIDPVGACVGMKGSRVQSVVQELRGEKIDIIAWHPDEARYVCNALAPAEISRVIIDEEAGSMEVIVHDDFLSVAIGKKGQNVRLASILTGWEIDVVSEESYSRSLKKEYEFLTSLPGVSMTLAEALHEKGFYGPEDFKSASVDELAQLDGVDEVMAGNILVFIQGGCVAEKVQEAVEAPEESVGEIPSDELEEQIPPEDEVEVDEDEVAVDEDEVEVDEDEVEVDEDKEEVDEDKEEVDEDEVEVDEDKEEVDEDEVDEDDDSVEPGNA